MEAITSQDNTHISGPLLGPIKTGLLTLSSTFSLDNTVDNEDSQVQSRREAPTRKDYIIDAENGISLKRQSLSRYDEKYPCPTSYRETTSKRRRRGTSFRDAFKMALDDLPELRATEVMVGSKNGGVVVDKCRPEEEEDSDSVELFHL